MDPGGADLQWGFLGNHGWECGQSAEYDTVDQADPGQFLANGSCDRWAPAGLHLPTDMRVDLTLEVAGDYITL
jgi:hypothetical protein